MKKRVGMQISSCFALSLATKCTGNVSFQYSKYYDKRDVATALLLDMYVDNIHTYNKTQYNAGLVASSYGTW